MTKYNREQVMGTDRDSFKYRAFITILSQNGLAAKEEPEPWKDIHKKQEFEISLVIEGVEIDYMMFVERYGSVFEMCSIDFERKIEERALEIVNERFRRTMDAVDEVLKTTCEEQIEYIKNELSE